MSRCVPSLRAGQSPCPTRGFQGGLGPISRGFGRGQNGAPAKPSAAGSLGRGGAVEPASFRPYGVEMREKVNCSAGAREAALGRMELATTRSRRKPWRFYGAWAVTSARSAGGFRGRRLTLFRVAKTAIDANSRKTGEYPRRRGIFADAMTEFGGI